MAFKSANPDAARRHIQIIISQVTIRVKDGWPEELRPPVLSRSSTSCSYHLLSSLDLSRAKLN
jgi:hypothetical protein